MQVLKNVPVYSPIGIDLLQMLSYSKSWFVDNQTPYIGANLYPPLATLLFYPFILINQQIAYKLFVLINLGTYTLSSILLVKAYCGKQLNQVVWISITTLGFFSYGLLFEIERGQFNLIALSMVFLSIWIFNNKPNLLWLSYLLFIISVQLKVYPIIFIVFFIKDWKDWKNGLFRISSLLMANIAGLFIMGFSVFKDFLKAISAQTIEPMTWSSNHSIVNFVDYTFSKFKRPIQPSIFEVLLGQTDEIKLFLFVVVTVAFFVILIHSIIKYRYKVSPFLLFACTITSFLIPPLSNDYKLSFLFVPMILLINEFHTNWWNSCKRLKITQIILLICVGFLFGSTLIGKHYKPEYFTNNFPALFLILLIVSLTCLIELAPIILKREYIQKNQ